MCLVSDKIKFCTCSGDDLNIDDLNHYWVLHRYNKDKQEMILGEANMPVEMKDRNFNLNRQAILTRVNEEDAFDQPLNFKKKDRLELVLNSQGDYENVFYYEFEYSGTKWRYIEHCPFNLMSNYDEMKTGKLEDVNNGS